MVTKLVGKLLPGDRVEARVFVGADREHLQLAGTLHLHVGEWQLLGVALGLGAKQMSGHFVFAIDDPLQARDAIARLGGHADEWHG